MASDALLQKNPKQVHQNLKSWDWSKLDKVFSDIQEIFLNKSICFTYLFESLEPEP